MAEEKKGESTEKKSLNIALIGTLALAVINLAAMGGGAFLVYQSTLGWVPPAITETDLRQKTLSERLQEMAQAEESVRAPASASGGEGAKKEKVKDPHSTMPDSDVPPPLVTRLEKFTVNLGGTPARTLRIEMSLEMLDPNSFAEVMDPVQIPKVRDRIIRILGETDFSSIESIQGKLFLKDRIVNDLNKVILAKGSVRDVYFSEFVVQPLSAN